MRKRSASHSLDSPAGFWEHQLRRYQASGLSGAAFCRIHALSPPSFYAWRRRLLFGSGPVPGTTRAPPPAPAQGVSWCEVALPGPGPLEFSNPAGLPLPSYALKAGAGAANGLWVEFPQFPCPEQLAAVCRAIHALPPLPC